MRARRVGPYGMCLLPLLITAWLSAAPLQGQGPDPKVLRSTSDYTRFSDGPRRVPAPRGAAQQRALALGLGTAEAAQLLLHVGPKPTWVAAARGKKTQRLLWPVQGGRFGRGFGFTRRSRADLPHKGIDIAAPEGAVIRAAAEGIVAYSDNGVRGFGNVLLIVHPGGWTTVYAHNYRNTVQAGWRVARGERIGFVGATGIARGPHLHFELRVDGKAIDPQPYLVEMPKVVRTLPDAHPEYRNRQLRPSGPRHR